MPVTPVNTSFQAYTQTAREQRAEGGSEFFKDLMKGVSFVGGVAVRGASIAVSKSAPGAAGLLGGGLLGGGAGGGLGGADGTDPASLLNLQIQLQRELLVFSTLSNVAKTQHETEMAAVRNMRP